jgi:hypothetical protein
MLVYRSGMRSARPMLVGACMVVFVAACSGSDPIDTEPLVVVGEDPVVSTSVVDVDEDAVESEIESPAPIRVDMTVEAGSIDGRAEIGGTVDPAALEDADPFGTFAACSGARRTFGPFAVTVSTPSGEVAAAAVQTVQSVTRPGIHDAGVRIELRSGEIESALGTVTIDDGWRSGTFVAFGDEGRSVNGSFVCSGGDPASAPLDRADTVGVLDSVEIVALLRRDGSERVVGLAVETARSPEVALDCPASIGAADGPLVVRVDGDQTVGAISTFELTDGGAPTVRMRVGGVSYEFDDVVISLADPATSGTFSVVDAGLAIDGAFRCT